MNTVRQTDSIDTRIFLQTQKRNMKRSTKRGRMEIKRKSQRTTRTRAMMRNGRRARRWIRMRRRTRKWMKMKG